MSKLAGGTADTVAFTKDGLDGDVYAKELEQLELREDEVARRLHFASAGPTAPHRAAKERAP